MRAEGRDIVELFGFQPDDQSALALKHWNQKLCPFTDRTCIKTNHDKSIIYGTCAVSLGDKRKGGGDVIICPNRFYADTHGIFSSVIEMAWPDSGRELVIGGTEKELFAKAEKLKNPVIAYGKFSGKEIQVKSGGNLSVDWVFHALEKRNGNLASGQFVALELQSIDITQNYRKNWDDYRKQKEGKPLKSVTPANHGLNWANVHKRLIPQIIRKGNVLSRTEKCAGFFFVLPDIVFQKFEDVIAGVATVGSPSRENLSVITYKLGAEVPFGKIRKLDMVRTIHYRLADVMLAFTALIAEDAPKQLEQAIEKVFQLHSGNKG